LKFSMPGWAGISLKWYYYKKIRLPQEPAFFV